MAEIRLTGLVKSFGDFIAVRNTSLTIADREFFVLLGPSGCGKTTTLRMIAGLELPSSGEIRIAGQDVTHRRASERDIAFVFQLFALYPHLSVRGNIGFPLRAQGVPRREIRTRVQEAARLLRIDHLLDRRVGGLAGGDRQRVALGRAIVRRPQAFLMDEPLGTLDAAFRQLMCEELRGLHDRIGATTVYVTHDQIEAMAMADRIAVMNDGAVLQVGTPDAIYHRPNCLFVAAFIGSPAMNTLPCRLASGRAGRQVELNGTVQAVPALEAEPQQADLVLGIRPEHVELDADAPLRGVIAAVDYMGARQIVTVDSTAGRLRVRAPNTREATVGERIGLRLPPKQIVLFDPASGLALPPVPDAEAALHG